MRSVLHGYFFIWAAMKTSSCPLTVVDSRDVDSRDVYSDLQATLRVKLVKTLYSKASPDDQTHYLLLCILLLLNRKRKSDFQPFVAHV